MKHIAKIVIGLVAAIALQPRAWGGVITYYHNDLAGSPVAATNEAGQLLWRESYRPYGERLTNSPAAIDSDVWFTSRRQDGSGLVYMGARYYDPVIGRFVSMDPKGFDEKNLHSHNRYAYANNNPYKYADPDGRWAQLLARPVYAISFEVATALGARELGYAAAAGLWTILNEGADSAKQPEGGKDSKEVQRPEGVPDHWVEQATRDGNGRQWVNPENNGDRVRSMPGDPASPNAAQQEPYVRDVRNGNQWLDVNGNRIEGREGRNSPTTHIPTGDYKFPQ